MKKCVLFIVFVLLFNCTAGYSYSDLPSDWAFVKIESLRAKNIVDASLFANYQDNISRSEFARLVVNLYEYYTDSEIEISHNVMFTDTSERHILKAASIGIVKGTGSNTFSPQQALNREQMSVMIMNMIKLSGINYARATGLSFNDHGQISSWAEESIYLARANGIVSGIGNNMFFPKGNLTTQQALVVAESITSNFVKPASISLSVNLKSVGEYMTLADAMLYDRPSLQGEAKYSLSKGKYVSITDFQTDLGGNIWGRTVNNTWILMSLVQNVEGIPKFTDDYVAIKDNVPLRMLPSASDSTIMVLNQGDQVTIVNQFYNDRGNLWGELETGYVVFMENLKFQFLGETGDEIEAVDIPVVQKPQETPTVRRTVGVKSTHSVNGVSYEKAMFPMEFMVIGLGVYETGSDPDNSHGDIYAIDLYGADDGKDLLFAPYTGTVKHIYTRYGNTIWFESSDKVLFADGTIDYMTILLSGADDISHLSIGKTIKQGEMLYSEGKSGKTLDNRIHLEVAKGKFIHPGWYQSSKYKIWTIHNSIHPQNAFFVPLEYTKIEDKGYQWTSEVKTIVNASEALVGKKITTFPMPYYDSYLNGNLSGYKHQCVSYVYNRLREKHAFTTGLFSMNLAKNGVTHAKDYLKKNPSGIIKCNNGMTITIRTYENDQGANIVPNSWVSFKYADASAAGHIVYVEDVQWINGIKYIYYSEGGSGFRKANTDGVMKKEELSKFIRMYGEGNYMGTITFFN